MNKIIHILVIDDDTRIRNLLSRYLKDQGYFVSSATDARDARRFLDQYIFDLLIVDVMMPNETGIEFTQKLRQNKTVPILMLTAMGDVEDRITGLSAGADDYLPKPFEPRELLLRVQKLLSRTRQSTDKMASVTFNSYTLDLATLRLTHQGTTIPLTSNEALLLQLLASKINQIVTRDEIAALSDATMQDRTIDVQVNRLRRKLEQYSKESDYLKTIRGKGYVLYGTSSSL